MLNPAPRCMARRKSRRKTRRRSKQGISLVNTAETIMLANVATQTLFNTNAYEFIVGNQAGMTARGVQAISLRELFQPNQATYTTRQMGGASTTVNLTTFDAVKTNLAANWMTGVAGMILIPLGFKFGKQIARPAISRTNRLLKKAGISSTVKV
jgi:hypothetical protein